MLRSLVGSEMCIRDSINAEYGECIIAPMADEELDLDDILASALDDMDDEPPADSTPAPARKPAPSPATQAQVAQTSSEPIENPEAMMQEILGAFADPEKLKGLMEEAGLKDEDGKMGDEFKMIADALKALDVGDQPADTGPSTGQGPDGSQPSTGASTGNVSDDNIAETLKMMQNSMGNLEEKMGASAGGDGGMAGLQSLLGNISEDEMSQVQDLLKGMEEGGEGGLENMLQKMMGQLLSPEVLGEPMKLAAEEYGKLLSDSSISEEQKGQYTQQLGPVSYTHLTLPTKRIVEISVVDGSLKKKT
eukprot:TRINITY_DN19755_c0_g2_i3.p1 TRINITY_DN19755_c0_g2~~TRINITY_DN19755_c0_g2_i3.p1  ORF type:complete len:321 (+),score=117.87 TRINITY_DN19755_c0_g2_i3:46-963(+)